MGRRKDIKNLEDYIQDATENVNNDRAIALSLLTKMVQNMNSSHDHKDLGLIAAKYLETLQRGWGADNVEMFGKEIMNFLIETEDDLEYLFDIKSN